MPAINPKVGQMEFVVDKVPLQLVSSQVVLFPLPVLHMHLSSHLFQAIIPGEMSDPTSTIIIYKSSSLLSLMD
jgi:hypothetical protein